MNDPNAHIRITRLENSLRQLITGILSDRDLRDHREHNPSHLRQEVFTQAEQALALLESKHT